MEIIKNYLKYSLWFVLIVFAALLGLHWLPVLTIDGHTMRRVDLLSDLRYPESEIATADSDSIPLPPVVKPVFVDTCRAGMTCIEDYSDSTLRGMAPFYEALNRISSSDSDDSDDKQVRIAVFGDSFIEADIFTADLREMLQKQFGGCGVGFVTITSMTSGYRPTVRHTFGGWSSHAVTDSIYFDKKKQGISGHYFVPRNGAYVELRGQNKYASLLDTCQRASIFFYNKDSVLLSARVNKGESKNYSLGPSDGLQQVQVDGRIGSIRWTVDRADSALFYGLAMDGKKGIILDNFSLRGSSGLSLRGIPVQTLKQFNRQRPYDLIILEYGLNVATERGRNYDNYQKGLITAIEHLKECFPQAGILLLSVGDRDYKNENGELRTMPGVKNLIRYQQNIAAESGIAFWNMFEAMGGEVVRIAAGSRDHINAMDMNKDYGDGANPVILKSEFIMSLCEQLIGGTNLGAKQKSIIDRCTASVYRTYQQNDYTGQVPTLQDFRDELLKQDEPEAKEIALAIELFTHGSLNTFAKQTNVDTHNRLICYDILDLGKQLMPIGMLVVLDSILNRITQNRAKGKNTFIFIDEIYLLFQHEYSANFLFTLWKRVRKYGAYASGITQNVDDLLQSHTARTMLANSEFIIMLNQASTDRIELAKLLNISDTQLSYITNVDAGHGLIKVGSSLVPFANKFPKNTKLYKLMTTKLSDIAN